MQKAAHDGPEVNRRVLIVNGLQINQLLKYWLMGLLSLGVVAGLSFGWLTQHTMN